ncbi:MAG: sugar phosphate isomerase/epimerase [Turicibacter sp.]|nr:sugar phosphate isomerase/epimerase [Turicibacter sp.]
MEIGYMTNGFGMLVGSGGGVTSAKDIRYVSLVDDKVVIGTIAESGYSMVEMFDGNLERFAANPTKLTTLLDSLKVKLGGVYVGANFIYEDSFPDELERIKATATLAAKLGAKHLILGGGAIRAMGILDTDYGVLAKNLDIAAKVIKEVGLIPTYHPHLGSIVESPEQIHRLFSLTDIGFCPDVAHLQAGGGNPLELIQTYYERIPYIHLKDYSSEGFVPLGEGDIDLIGIANFLKEKNYQGDILAEIDGYAGCPTYACQVSYQFIQKHVAVKNKNLGGKDNE